MQRISRLVEENDLELSKAFEKIMDESILRMRAAERLSTKFVLLRTLQHEIRQPLSYIYNSAEMLLTGMYEDERMEMIEKILVKSKEIEKMLNRLETNSELPFKKYSDNLPIIDLSKNR
jgi:signal transduction histidine kinase